MRTETNARIENTTGHGWRMGLAISVALAAAILGAGSILRADHLEASIELAVSFVLLMLVLYKSDFGHMPETTEQPRPQLVTEKVCVCGRRISLKEFVANYGLCAECGSQEPAA